MSLQVNDRMLWPLGKKRAFTLSYDDGITQDIRFSEMCRRYNVKCTFNLNSGLFGTAGRVAAGAKEVDHIKIAENEIEKIYEGFELAGHGQFHSCMVGMDQARCVEEILESRKALERILKKPVTGFAYAFGAYDDTVILALKACGISYARTIVRTGDFGIPKDFLTWDPTCHHDDPEIFNLIEDFLSDKMYFNMLTPAKLFYVWGHSYEFDQRENWDHMEEVLKKVSGHESVWYATNGEICEYVNAYRSLIFSADGKYVYNPTATAVWLGGTFTDKFIKVRPGETGELVPPIDM